MNKKKVIFSQTMMISTAILFAIGAQSLILHFKEGSQAIEWQWYIPMTIVLAGFLCALPTYIIFAICESASSIKIVIGLIVHFLLVGGIVSLCGFLFGWYSSWDGYFPILVMYVLIYLFVWSATVWIGKNDEKKINSVIGMFKDKE